MKYRNCSSNRAIHHQLIFESSLLEVLSVKKYSDISVTDIAGQAGLSRKSFYHYFDGKDGCLQALIDHTILNFHSNPTNHPSDTLSVVAILDYWKEQYRLIDGLYQNHMIDLLLSRILFFATVEEGFRTYVARETECVTREQIVLLVGGLFAVLVDWHLSGYEKDSRELAACLNHLMDRIR